MNNIIFRILGCILILWGISIFINPLHYSSRFGRIFDYTGISIPLGLIIAALGGIFVWSTFRKKKIKAREREPDLDL